MSLMNKITGALSKWRGLPKITNLEQIRGKTVVPINRLTTRFSDQNRDVCLLSGGLCKTFVRRKNGTKVSIARIMSNKEVMDVICRRFDAKELFNGKTVVDAKVLTTSTVIQLLISTGAKIEEAIGPEGRCFLVKHQCVENCSRLIMLVVKGILLARRERMIGDTLRISGDTLRKIKGKIQGENDVPQKSAKVHIHPKIPGRVTIIQDGMKPTAKPKSLSIENEKMRKRVSGDKIRQLMQKKAASMKIGSAARVRIGGKKGPEIFKEIDDIDRLNIAEKIPGFYEWNISDSTKIEIIEKILNKETTIERVAEVIRKELKKG